MTSLRVIVLFLLVAATSLADQAEAWNFANASYRDGNFPEALKWYADVVAQTDDPASLPTAVWFNIGTTLAKMDRKNEAIGYLRRAHWMSPGHDGASANLRRIDPGLVLAADEPLDGWRYWVRRVHRGPAIYLLVGIALLWVATIVVNLGRATEVTPSAKLLFFSRWLWRVALLLTIPMAVIMPMRPHPAATVIQEAEARSGPSHAFKPLEKLLPGMAIELLASQPTEGHWSVALPGGRAAYVPQDALLPLAPRRGEPAAYLAKR